MRENRANSGAIKRGITAGLERTRKVPAFRASREKENCVRAINKGKKIPDCESPEEKKRGQEAMATCQKKCLCGGRPQVLPP